jgi:hypothetical protein
MWKKMLTTKYGCPALDNKNDPVNGPKAFCWCGIDKGLETLPAGSFNVSSESDEVNAEQIFILLEDDAVDTRALLTQRLDGALVRKGGSGACANKGDGGALKHVGPFWTSADMVSCARSTDGSVDQIAHCLQGSKSSMLGVSSGCAHCFGLATNCGMSNCIDVCGCEGEYSEGPCQSCMKQHCESQFEGCSGIGLPSEVLEDKHTSIEELAGRSPSWNESSLVV